MNITNNNSAPFSANLLTQDGKPAVATPDFMSALQAANRAAASAIASAAKKEPDGVMSGKEALTAALEGRTDEKPTGLAENLTTFGAAIDRVSDGSIRSIQDLRNALQGLVDVKVVQDLKSDDGVQRQAIATDGTVFVDSKLADDPDELTYTMREELAEIFYRKTFGKSSQGDFGMETNGRYMGVASENEITMLRSSQASDEVAVGGIPGETFNNPKPPRVVWSDTLSVKRDASGMQDARKKLGNSLIKAAYNRLTGVGKNSIIVYADNKRNVSSYRGWAANIRFENNLSRSQVVRFSWDAKRKFNTFRQEAKQALVKEPDTTNQKQTWLVYQGKNPGGNVNIFTGASSSNIQNWAKDEYGFKAGLGMPLL